MGIPNKLLQSLFSEPRDSRAIFEVVSAVAVASVGDSEAIEAALVVIEVGLEVAVVLATKEAVVSVADREATRADHLLLMRQVDPVAEVVMAEATKIAGTEGSGQVGITVEELEATGTLLEDEIVGTRTATVTETGTETVIETVNATGTEIDMAVAAAAIEETMTMVPASDITTMMGMTTRGSDDTDILRPHCCTALYYPTPLRIATGLFRWLVGGYSMVTVFLLSFWGFATLPFLFRCHGKDLLCHQESCSVDVVGITNSDPTLDAHSAKLVW